MFDQSLFNAINGLAGASSFLDWLGILITNFGIPILGLAILLIRKKNVIFKGLFSLVFASGFAFAIKQILQMPRPDVGAIITSTNFGFPSSHTANAFALAMTLYFYNKKIGISAFIFAALIGLSRIFIGAHWPSDILAGAALGLLIGYFVEKKLGKQIKQKKRK